MTPQSQSDVGVDEKASLLRHSGSSGPVSPRALNALHQSSRLVGQSKSLSSSARSSMHEDMSGKEGGQRKGQDESGIPLLDESATGSQSDSSWGRFKLLPWSRNKASPTSAQSPEKALGKTAMAALEEGVKFHVAKVKSKVSLKWPRRQESKEDEEFKRACVDDLNKRTRDAHFGVHASAPCKPPASKPERKVPGDQSVPEGSSGVRSKLESNENTQSPQQCFRIHSSINPMSSTVLCTSPTTKSKDSLSSSSFVVSETMSQSARLKETCDSNKNQNATNGATSIPMQGTRYRNPLMKSDSADKGTEGYHGGFRPPLYRAASASAASSEMARRARAEDGRHHSSFTFYSEQRPTASKSFFSIEYLKANLKLDLKLPDMPLPKSFKSNQSMSAMQESKSAVSNDPRQVSPPDYTSVRLPDKDVSTSSRHTMTDDAASSKAQNSRYLRLSAFVPEPGRGWTKPVSGQDKNVKITQRKPKHPPQNIRRAPSTKPDIMSVNTSTQTSPVTVQMIDLGELHSPPCHPDFDPSYRPWHLSSTASCLWSPRGNAGVDALLSDEFDEGSDSTQSSPSSAQDWQQFRQLSPITEAESSSDSEVKDNRGRSMLSSSFHEDMRNRYPEEMMKHKSFQNVQDEDSPSPRSITKEDFNQMSPRDRYRSPIYSGSNRLMIPGIFADGAYDEAQHAPSLKNWARGSRSTGSFSTLESPKSNGQPSQVSRSFDTGLTAKGKAGYLVDEYKKRGSFESSPRTQRKGSNLTVNYNSIHRSHTDSHLDDHQNTKSQHEPLIRQRSDSAAFERASKRSLDPRRLSEHRHSCDSPSSEDINGRRRRSSPKIERHRSESMVYDNSQKRSPETRRLSDQRQTARSPSSDETNGRRRRSSPKTDDSKKSRAHLLRQTPAFSQGLWMDDNMPPEGIGMKWFDVDEDWSSLSSYTFDDNGMVVSHGRARSFDNVIQSSSRTQEGKTRNSLSPRDDRRDSFNRQNDAGNGHNIDKRRARSFDSSCQNGNRTPETKKRNSLSPRNDRRESFNRQLENNVGNDQERKSPVIKRNKRVEALSPLIMVSRSFDERVSGHVTPPKDSPRRRRTTGSLSLLTEHNPLPDSGLVEKRLENDSAARRSKAVNRCKGKVIARVYSDETNRRFVPLERQERPRRVYSAPSASSPPPSPLYPTVHVVPPPDPVPRNIDFHFKQSHSYEERGSCDGRRDEDKVIEREKEREREREICSGHSTPVINIDALECPESTAEDSREQECHVQATWDPRHRMPLSTKHAAIAGNRSFDMPSRASSFACSETHRRAASFSSFSAPSREACGSDTDDDGGEEEENSRDLESVAGYSSNRREGKTSALLRCKQTGPCFESQPGERESPLRSSSCHLIQSPHRSRSSSQSDRFPHEEFGAKPIQRLHEPVTRSYTDGDVVVDADRKLKTCGHNRRVTSLDSNPLVQLQTHHAGGPALRHMTENVRHVTTASESSSSSKCALGGLNTNETPPAASKQRSRSYDVACDSNNHRDSLTEACSNIRKAVQSRKASSPLSYSSNSNSNGNSIHNSNSNLLNIPVWNSALGKFSSSDSRLAVPGQTHGTPLKKTSSVPPSFPDTGTPPSKPGRSVSLHSSPSFQPQCSGKTIRHHSTDESALGRHYHLPHSHYYSNSRHSSPHIATLTPSPSAGERRFGRHGHGSPRSSSSSLRGDDSYYAIAISNSQQHFSDRGTPTSVRSGHRRVSSQESGSGRSVTSGQVGSQQALCQQTQANRNPEACPEDIETTPLLSAPMAGAVDGRGIEIIVSDENDTRVSSVQTGKRAVFRRIWMVLLDNRMAGRPDCERALRPHPEEYRVLKRILNIVFITVGVALLLSVFVVIIYTYVGE